jgi:hypothetical protein
MTADAAHVAAVESALMTLVRGSHHDAATVAVETLTPLIRAQVAATLAPGVTTALLNAYALGRDDEAAALPVRTPDAVVSLATGATP